MKTDSSIEPDMIQEKKANEESKTAASDMKMEIEEAVVSQPQPGVTVTMNEGALEKPQVDIKVPENYVQLLEAQQKEYRKWLKKNEQLQAIADEAETDEAMQDARKKATEHFKRRYGGIIAKDQGERLSVSKVMKIWDNFMRREYRSFLAAHTNLSLATILEIGLDKFIYTLGWRKPSDASTWRNNKVRIGVCCHCNDQFLPLMFQYNHGLCANCRPMYSVAAIREYILRVLETSARYEDAHRDLLMDFYIMFYHNPTFRIQFLLDTETTKELEHYADVRALLTEEADSDESS